VKAPTIPLHLEVHGAHGAPKPVWNMEVAHDQFMAPMFAAMAIGAGVEETAAERRDVTWRAESKIKVAKYGTVTVHDFRAAAGNPVGAEECMRGRVARSVGMLLNNPWEAVHIEGIETSVKMTFEREVSQVRGAKVLEPEIDAGSSVRIRLDLQPFQGKTE